MSVTRPLGLALTAARAGTPAPAEERRVCVVRATLTDAPNGLTVGWVTRGHQVLVLRRTADGRWTRVRTDFGARGWLRSRHLCRAEP